jgi:predicted DNA-binding transcriptional regulator YafY
VDALEEDSQLHHFRVDRVLSVEATDARFEPPPVDAAAYRRELMFDAPAEMLAVDVDVDLPALGRVLAGMRGVEAVERGPERARVRVRGANLHGILRVLFAAGPGWEVVAPEAARELVRAWTSRSNH